MHLGKYVRAVAARHGASRRHPNGRLVHPGRADDFGRDALHLLLVAQEEAEAGRGGRK